MAAFVEVQRQRKTTNMIVPNSDNVGMVVSPLSSIDNDHSLPGALISREEVSVPSQASSRTTENCGTRKL